MAGLCLSINNKTASTKDGLIKVACGNEINLNTSKIMENTTITKQEKEIFDYLNDLRDSGITNMFGATPYIVEAFEIDKREASPILSKWMRLYNADGYENLTIKD